MRQKRHGDLACGSSSSPGPGKEALPHTCHPHTEWTAVYIDMRICCCILRLSRKLSLKGWSLGLTHAQMPAAKSSPCSQPLTVNKCLRCQLFSCWHRQKWGWEGGTGPCRAWRPNPSERQVLTLTDSTGPTLYMA